MRKCITVMGKNFFCITMMHIVGEGIKAWYNYGEGIIRITGEGIEIV